MFKAELDRLRHAAQPHAAQSDTRAVEAAMRIVMDKANGAPASDDWTMEMKATLKDILESCLTVRPCDWCLQPGHETSSCWVGAQCYRNGESRRIVYKGTMVNVWTHFKKVLQLERAR